MTRILIIGGGTGGITVAARLRRAAPDFSITLLEPSKRHFYQPLWTLVGAGICPASESERNEAALVPEGVEWITEFAETFDPDNRAVTTREGRRLEYDFLVVAPGLQINWNKVEGLAEALKTPGVGSNYSIDTVDKTWQAIREFKGGAALFTQPAGAIKCGGAPQKICYLAEDWFRRQGIRDNCKVIFASAGPRIFAVDKYATALEEVIARRGIEARFGHNLIALRPDRREAVFATGSGEQVVIRYDLLHVTPPQGPPDFIARSPLADAEGWVDVDRHTLQHRRWSNIFSLGDASSLPTSKTGAAIRKQAPVLVDNLLAAAAGQPLNASYDGYTSCPLVTGYNSLILAEFDYDKRPVESFPFDQSRERFSMFLLKRHGLPALYWHGMLRGRA